VDAYVDAHAKLGIACGNRSSPMDALEGRRVVTSGLATEADQLLSDVPLDL
jgi:hypothetical protein